MHHCVTAGELSIERFTWPQWSALWQLRFCHLAEQGIHLPLAAIPPQPTAVDQSDAEWDYHQMAAVYLQGAGGFWLAYQAGLPVGHIGGQAIGRGVELRRMYVRATFRRRGIGQQLVKTLVEHCRKQGVTVIELWTAPDGAGRKLYETLHFQQVDQPGKAFVNLRAVTGYTPGPAEIRMRLQLD
jgi:GNAT superfamily N-acetyltransferase